MIEEGIEKEVKKIIQKEMKYSDEEMQDLEVYDDDEIIEYFEELIKNEIGVLRWEWLSRFIDIKAMIEDEVAGGELMRVCYKGKYYYFRPL